jgi:hypothetical protein
MKHCPRCRQEYEDWVANCADCSTPLRPGPPPAETSDYVPPRAPTPRERRESRPRDSECVFSGPPEFAEPLALALANAGIPAFTSEAAPEEEDPEDGGELPEGFLDVRVPKERYALALWFVKGFEAAGGLGSGEDGGEVQEPGEPA